MRAGRPLFVALNESTHTDRIHLLRAAVPVAWAVWGQNLALASGEYWQYLDAVCAQVTAVVPTAQRVCVLADRAYGVAPLLDRYTARGWQYVVRFRTEAANAFGARGREGGGLATIWGGA